MINQPKKQSLKMMTLMKVNILKLTLVPLVVNNIVIYLKLLIKILFMSLTDEHRVQRYGDDHPELIEGESGSASASASPKLKGKR